MRPVRIIDWGMAVVLTGIIAVHIGAPWVGRLEGRISPVVTQGQFEVSPETEVTSSVTGSFFIDRPRCEFRALEWRIVTPVRTALADVVFSEGTRARPGGWNDFGPWIVAADDFTLTHKSIAVAFHRCPFRPWLTRTHFYP